MYIYDVRGIQGYIFRTNKMKEVMGASALVESLIISLFRKCTESEGSDKTVLYDLKEGSDTVVDPSKALQFMKGDIDAEILYYGGGNLLVLYKEEEFAERVSIAMCRELIKRTYSLRMAYAGVDITGNFSEDSRRLRERMNKKKLDMPPAIPVPGFPVTVNDPVTGMPFSEVSNNRMCTYESKVKLASYARMNFDAQQINTFGAEEGDSLIAVVHIDGNSMGKYIRDNTQNVTDYEKAAETYRTLSERIQETFVEKTLGSVIDSVDDFCRVADMPEKIRKNAFRKIIGAGDDITFICNARIAMNCVRKFMSELERNNIENGTSFTACGGVYVTHSHFPFARAYECAEELCDSAKKKSRKVEGNYVDFYLNTGGILNSLDVLRDEFYTYPDGKKVYERPYHLGGQSEDNSSSELDELISTINTLNSTVARTKLKGLREAFSESPESVMNELRLVNSRLESNSRINITDEEGRFDYRKAGILFDAIDVLDLKWGETYDGE